MRALHAVPSCGISLAAHVAVFALLALPQWRPVESREDGDQGGMLQARILAVREDRAEGDDPRDRPADVNAEYLGTVAELEALFTDPVPEEDEARQEERGESAPGTPNDPEPFGAPDAPLSSPEEADAALDLPMQGDRGAGILGIGGAARGLGVSRGGRRNLRTGGEGGRWAEGTIEHALRWLFAHQSTDGAWEAAEWIRWCDGVPAGARRSASGNPAHDVGVTGLALLAFLGAGYTNRGDHPYAKAVGNGLRYLKQAQDAEGCFGRRSRAGNWIYDHAVASLAMVEAYGMTRSTLYRRPAQKALDFIAAARNPGRVWRYGVRPGDDDTSVTGWMMMALESARQIVEADRKAGKPDALSFDRSAFDDLGAWIESVTDPGTGRVGYLSRGLGPVRPIHQIEAFPPRQSEALTAVGMLGRLFLGQPPKTQPELAKGAALCGRRLPSWNPRDGSIDMTYWYYGTLAMFQMGGGAWNRWNDAMKTAIVDTQHLEDGAGGYCGTKGSWDPVDPWGPEGGRVYSTAILAMCLEVYFRYDKVFGVHELR